MKKYIVGLAVIGFIIPSVMFAACPKVKTIVKKVPDPALQAKIDSLTATNALLQSQITDLQAKLASQNTAGGNLTEARSIRVSLARLDQLDFMVDNIKDEGLLPILNTEKLGGKLMFTPQNIHAPVIGPDNTIVGVPSHYLLHQIIDNYRQELKVELAAFE